MLDHLDDIASDFSAFHRITDIGQLPGPVFFRLAFRLGAYAGVMQARIAEAQEQQGPAVAPAPDSAPRQENNPGTKSTLLAEPAFRGVFEFG